MRRSVVLVPLLLLLAACGGQPVDVPLIAPAAPQIAELRWDERFPATGPGIRYTVETFEVTRAGWRAQVGIENTTKVSWELGLNPLAVSQVFGIALFETGDIAEVAQRDRRGDLSLRAATSFTPELPDFIGPGESWSGRVEGLGSLPEGLWVRVVIGPLITRETPPDELGRKLVWYTDHAYRLQTRRKAT
jgi:hypothetical protein